MDYEIDELLAMVEVANETAQSEIAVYGMNYEAYEALPWFDVEPWDDGYEDAFREMYETEIRR